MALITGARKSRLFGGMVPSIANMKPKSFIQTAEIVHVRRKRLVQTKAIGAFSGFEALYTIQSSRNVFLLLFRSRSKDTAHVRNMFPEPRYPLYVDHWASIHL